MNVEFMCGLLANYSKELYEAETIHERGDVQLKHAKMILDKVENCSIPAVSCWISVKEKLPCNDGTYLTFTKNKVSESIGFTLFIDGQFMSSFVTHWAIVENPCK